MIAWMTGRLVQVTSEAAYVEVGGAGVELLIPGNATELLAARVGETVTLHTVLYLEGSVAGANLIPRLLGFVTEADRTFFRRFTRVKGVSMRRGLRAMAVPVEQIAAAIEAGDTRLLTALPEIGKKTAQEIINELRGHLADLVLAGPVTAVATTELTGGQRVAVEILVQWGDRRADAERWVAAAVEQEPTLQEPDAIVRAAYRAKVGGV